MFYFSGEVLTSKSWLNRAQVIQYFNPELKLLNVNTTAEDVLYMRDALTILHSKTQNKFLLGQGGTSFRFFCFLVSRLSGDWNVEADATLMRRPQSDFLNLFNQLGVSCEPISTGLKIYSTGWKWNKPIRAHANSSSQFLSGLLLSAWSLPEDLELQIEKPISSQSYLKLTIELLQKCGMKILVEESKNLKIIKIPRSQKSQVTELVAEADVSSAFSLASAAVVSGNVCWTNFNTNSLQPDIRFLDVFRKMKIKFEIIGEQFKVAKHKSWHGIEQDISDCVDLFPVLAVLCGLAHGKSRLFGGAHLAHKESDRIKKTSELLTLFQISNRPLSDGIEIEGCAGQLKANSNLVNFDPSDDHRMAMAAALFQLHGAPINILNKIVVQKSYPRFWHDVGLL